MKLVWHADGLLEADWLRDVLGGIVDDEVRDLDCTCFDDDTIHVISSNWRALPLYRAYAAACRSRCRRLALVHLSDEWYSGGYALYASFDTVIRNFHTRLADDDGILTIPEGYANGTRRDGVVKPATERRHAWSFVGELKTSRMDMVRAFEDFGPRWLQGTGSISASDPAKLAKPAYDALLADSVFSPCPMGNAILETWRLYESLELGCIPLVERRPTLDYFRDLFGPNPIPAFRSWNEARSWAERAYSQPEHLMRLQGEIGDWWQGHKEAVRAEIAATLLGPTSGPALRRFAALKRNQYSILHEPLRLRELLRHQSKSTLVRRLRRPLAPLRRIARDTLGG